MNNVQWPICPFCNEVMWVTRFSGHYETLLFWVCGCDEEDLTPHIRHTIRGDFGR